MSFLETNHKPSPFLQFRLSTLNDQRHFALLKELASKRILKAALRERAEPGEQHPMPWKELKHRLNAYAREAPVARMPRFLEEKIWSFISKEQLKMHTKLTETVMEEARSHYDETMREYSINQLLKKNDQLKRMEENCLDHRIYTEWPDGRRERFEKAKERMEKMFLLTRRSVGGLLSFLRSELPIFQLSLKPLLPKRPLSERSFFNALFKGIDGINETLRWTWYPCLINMLKRKIVQRTCPRRLYNCLEGLIVIHLNEMKADVLAGLLKFLTNEDGDIPMIAFKLELNGNGGITLNPTLETLESFYEILVLKIANLGVGLLPTLDNEIDGSLYGAKGKFSYINMRMEEIYLAEFISDVKQAVRATYKPVAYFLKSFQERYEFLLSAVKENDLADFEVLFRALSMLQLEPKSFFLRGAIINNGSLLQSLFGLAESVKCQLMWKHFDLLQEILKEVEALKFRALKTPASTEELFELAAFVYGMHITDLQHRVNEAQLIGNRLLGVAKLHEQHLRLNLQVLNSSEEIDEIREFAIHRLDKFYICFRAHLESVEKKLHLDLRDLAGKMEMLKGMSNLNNSSERRIFIQIILRQLHEVQDYATWIKKEELLFDLPLSKFPVFEEIVENIGKIIK